MNKTNIFLALLSGFIATSLVYAHIRDLEKGMLTDSEVVRVVIAANPIKKGEVITPNMLEERNIPVRFKVEGGVSKMEEAVGKYALVDIVPGEQVIKGRVGTTEGGVTFERAPRLPDGLRAMMLSLSEDERLDGFLKAGDHVDVIAVLHSPNGEGEVSLTVLQNVEVLSAGAPPEGSTPFSSDVNLQNAGFTEYTVPSSTVLLAVTPAEAQKLALLNEYGKMRLSLRSRADSELKALEEVNVNSILRAEGWQGHQEVEVIRGIDVEMSRIYNEPDEEAFSLIFNEPRGDEHIGS